MAALTVLGLMLLVIAAWTTGRLASDRWWWSQWLLWIPTPAALVAAAVGCVAALLPRMRKGAPRRRRLRLWAVMTILIAAYFALVEHRLLRAGRTVAGGLRLVHWNMDPHRHRPPRPDGSAVIGLNGDLTILTHGIEALDDPALRQWLGADGQAFTLWPFTVLTRLPIVRLQPLISVDEIEVAILIVDAREALGREAVVYLVDLPSDPRRSRAAIAEDAQRMLAEVDAPPPDVVVGDFNMTRGSASLKRIFPHQRHAYDEAGHGYGATFRRDRPLYHIDHTLLGPGLRAAQYDLIDTGRGRHRAQAIVLKPRG